MSEITNFPIRFRNTNFAARNLVMGYAGRSEYSHGNNSIMTPTSDDKLSFLIPDDDQDAGKSDKFSFTNFAEHFDDHINRSIRGYAELRDDIVRIGRYLAENRTILFSHYNWFRFRNSRKIQSSGN